MIIRKLRAEQYRALCGYLAEAAAAEPLSASYAVTVTVDGVAYLLRVQPEKRFRVALLQAVKLGDAPRLVAGGDVLAGLLALLVERGTAWGAWG